MGFTYVTHIVHTEIYFQSLLIFNLSNIMGKANG